MITRLFLLGFLILSYATYANSESEGVVGDSLSKSFDVYLNGLNSALPFYVQVAPNKKVYINPVWGVDIVDISADGVGVPKMNFPGTIDGIDTRMHTMKSHSFIYSVNYYDMLFAEWSTDKEEIFNLYHYKLPKKFKSLSITYRLKFPDETISSEQYILNVYVDGNLVHF